MSAVLAADSGSRLTAAAGGPAVLPSAPKNVASGSVGSVPSFELGVDLCCILAGRVLLILGWHRGLDEKSTAVELTVGSSTWDFRAGRVLMACPDLESGTLATPGPGDTQRYAGFIFLAEMAAPGAIGETAQFELFTGAGVTRARCAVVRDSSQACHDLLALLRKLEPDAAIESVERICERLRDSPDECVLRDSLVAEHRAAVERLPDSLHCSQPRYCLYLDGAFAVMNDGIFLHGWFEAEPDAHCAVACHAGFDSIAIGRDWVRHPRGDVTSHLAQMGIRAAGHDHGFSSYVTLKDRQSPCFIAVTSRDGLTRRMRLIFSVSPPIGPMPTVGALLKSFNMEHRDLRAMLDRQIGPAVQAAWSQRSRARESISVQRFGPQPVSPAVSIIVPLYGRHDFAEYQLALYADDPDFQHNELLYFVDDPNIYDDFRLRCHDLHALYGVPFTLLFAGSNLGFAAANNRAAEIARGGKLLLLNSDVFPKRPGWVGTLTSVYDALESPGLLGVKLLYEDGSVQHVGMSFRRNPGWGDLWINYHPYKGQSPLGLDGVREVAAVTAACVMVDSGLYRELGGLSEDYIVGDFEDSDLCLRAAAAGRRNRVALDIELFHLERQSQNLGVDAQWRKKLTVYNCWQHHQRWAEVIGRGVS